MAAPTFAALRFRHTELGIEAYIHRNNRTYTLCVIRRCNTPKRQWFITPRLADYTQDWHHLYNPVPTLRQARINAHALGIEMLKDLHNVTLQYTTR